MKYIIGESRLESLVMNFLDDKFKGMKKHVDHLGGSSYTWWGVGSYGMLDMTHDDEGVMGFGVNSNIWESLKGTFGLSSTLTDDFLKMWVEKNLGLSPHEIYVF